MGLLISSSLAKGSKYSTYGGGLLVLGAVRFMDMIIVVISLRIIMTGVVAMRTLRH